MFFFRATIILNRLNKSSEDCSDLHVNLVKSIFSNDMKAAKRLIIDNKFLLQDVIDEYIERTKRRGPSYKEIDPSCLKWTPFVAPPHPGAT